MGQRRNRNGQVPVNPNPRPPNEPRHNGGATSTQQSRLDHYLSKLQRKAQMPNIPGPASQQPLQATSGNPASVLGTSSFQPSAGQPDPRTPDYWRNLTNLTFNTQGTLSQLNLEGQRSSVDYEKQLADMATARGREQRALGGSAISQGLGSSGWLLRNEAEDTHDYLRNYEDAQTAYERSKQDRQTAYSQAIQDYIAGEGDLAGSALSDYFASQQDQAQNANPLIKPRDIRKLNKILKPNRGGGGGGGHGGGGRGHGGRH